jgi:hypothetical protein
VQQLVRIACWLPPPLHYRRYVMQQVKVLSCIAVKEIYVFVLLWQSAFLVFVTQFQLVRR